MRCVRGDTLNNLPTEGFCVGVLGSDCADHSRVAVSTQSAVWRSNKSLTGSKSSTEIENNVNQPLFERNHSVLITKQSEGRNCSFLRGLQFESMVCTGKHFQSCLSCRTGRYPHKSSRVKQYGKTLLARVSSSGVFSKEQTMG